MTQTGTVQGLNWYLRFQPVEFHRLECFSEDLEVTTHLPHRHRVNSFAITLKQAMQNRHVREAGVEDEWLFGTFKVTVHGYPFRRQHGYWVYSP